MSLCCDEWERLLKNAEKRKQYWHRRALKAELKLKAYQALSLDLYKDVKGFVDELADDNEVKGESNAEE